MLFPSFDNLVYCLNGSNGETLWAFGPLSSRPESGVAVLPNGVFAFGGTDNNVYAIKTVGR